MKSNNTIIEEYRVKTGRLGTSPIYGNNGYFLIYVPGHRVLNVLVSDSGGWDHVSVSIIKRKNSTPNWDEMNYIKDLFFDPEETVVQFHTKKSEYINTHNGCLHLWRNQTVEYDLPPQIMVG